MTAVLRHIKTNILYRHLWDDRYRNLSTGVEGEVPPEIAKNIFAINLDATALLNANPNIENLILALSLKIENNKEI